MSIYYLHKPLAYLMCAVILVKAKMIACRLSLFIIFQQCQPLWCCCTPKDLSNLSYRAGTFRGSHYTFDFYFPSQLNRPPEMWNFVKWDTSRGKSRWQPAPWLCGICLQTKSTESNKQRTGKTRRNERVNQIWWMEGDTMCVSFCLSLYPCASGRLFAWGQRGSQDGFVRSRGLCCAPLGSRMLFQDATCWGMYSAHSFDGPLRSSPLNRAEMASAAAE